MYLLYVKANYHIKSVHQLSIKKEIDFLVTKQIIQVLMLYLS